jgi:hypothetical protein
LKESPAVSTIRTPSSYPASHKRFVQGSRADLRVPYREISVRFSRLPDSRWSIDVGTGHLGATLAPGLNIKVNNALAIAANFRF